MRMRGRLDDPLTTFAHYAHISVRPALAGRSRLPPQLVQGDVQAGPGLLGANAVGVDPAHLLEPYARILRVRPEAAVDFQPAAEDDVETALQRLDHVLLRRVRLDRGVAGEPSHRDRERLGMVGPVFGPVDRAPDLRGPERAGIQPDTLRAAGVALDRLAVADVQPGMGLLPVDWFLAVALQPVKADLAAGRGVPGVDPDVVGLGPVPDGDHRGRGVRLLVAGRRRHELHEV